MSSQIKNLPQSVHDRLKVLAKTRERSFQEFFYYYSIERFLYRLSKSSYASNFVLKGGLMFFGWGIQLRRPTRDIDLQGDVVNTIENLTNIVRDICAQEVEPDGMRFDPDSVRGEQIIDIADYPGIRIYIIGYLGQASIHLHLDISFANIITPGEIIIEYPSLLDMPEFEMRGYPFETAIAEKFHSMVVLDSINDRMKDFYDIWLLSHQIEITGKTVARAIQATFQRRSTPLPKNLPTALTLNFGESRQADWKRFLRRSGLEPSEHPSFIEIVSILRNFLWPAVKATEEHMDLNTIWKPGGPWKRV